MKKHSLIIIVLALFLVGCDGISGPSEQENYKTGTRDVDLDFFGDNVAYQDRSLNLFMRLRNTLGYPIDNVKISVVGLDEAYVDLSNREEVIGSMEGKSIFSPDGGVNDIEFSGLVRSLPLGAKEIDQNYFVYIDYISKMDFTPTICVGPVLYSVDDGGCKGHERTQKLSYSGQGAPLAVTNMEVVSWDDYVQLILVVADKGSKSGTVNGEVREVSLATANLGGKPMNCEFVGYSSEDKKSFVFTKNKKQTELLCDITVGRSSTYETPLQMEFFYDYKLKIKQELKLKGGGPRGGQQPILVS